VKELLDRCPPGLRIPAWARADRPRVLPSTSWTGDRGRCRAAGVPNELEFTTKPQLSIAMLKRIFATRVSFSGGFADPRRIHGWHV